MVEAPKWGVSLREGKHEPLISFETFQKIQHRLNSTAKVPARKNLNADFPLRGAVQCGDCGKPLTACWSKSKTGKRHAYYMCHNRACVSARKSIPRSKIEGEFKALLEELQPSKSLFDVTRAMFKDVWNYRLKNTQLSKHATEKELLQVEKQTEQLLDRIVEADSPAVISAYESRISKLEKDKLVLQEKIKNSGKPLYPFEQMFELSMKFLSSPCKLWDSGKLELQRIVLKLAFADRLAYCRKNGFRTPQVSEPFNFLENIMLNNKMARQEGFEPPTA